MNANSYLVPLLDLVLPHACASCGITIQHNHPFCEACRPSVMAAPDDPSHPRSLASAHAVLLYGGHVAHAIQRLKYEGAAHLARPLGRLMHQAIVDRIPRIDVILPVPLHPSRLVGRGYNQAGLLAASAARGTGVPVRHRCLRRIRATASQQGLSRDARCANVQGAFKATRVAGASVLLVDDVATTRCTASACAGALLAAGAIQVHLLTLARAVP